MVSTIIITEDMPYYPAVVALEVTLKCNMKCMHCGSSAPGVRQNELTLDEWKDVVDQLVNLNTDYIVLSGGEPFIWGHWRELCLHIKKYKKMFSIISNGYLINEADAFFLKEVGIRRIGISIDGMEEAHNKIRNIRDAFERAIQSIKTCKKARLDVAVSTSVNKLNYNDLDELKVYLEDIGIDIWQVQVVNSFGRAGEMRNKLIITPQQYTHLIEKVYQYQSYGRKNNEFMQIVPADSLGYCYGISKKIWGEFEWSGCNAGRYVAGIKSNGDVVGCLSLQDDRFVAGNVRNRNLVDIWSDDSGFEYNRKFKKGNLKGICKNCKFASQCKGGCLAMGYSITGEMNNNPYCYYGIKRKNFDNGSYNNNL